MAQQEVRPGHTAGGTGRRQPPVLPIRGRTEQVAAIDAHIADLRAGRGSALLIDGPPGIGKSRLLDEVVVRARAAGAQTLTSMAFEDQQTVPFAALFEAILPANPPICEPAVLRELSATADLRYWVVDDLQTAVATAAARTPLVIAIDDVHWADAGTAVALRALIPGLVDAPVLWALAMRSAGGRHEVRDAIAAISTARASMPVRQLSLGALDTDAVASISGDVLNARPDESLLRLAEMAHGNPFLVLELLQGLNEESRLAFDAGLARTTGRALPRRLATTMERRLERLSPAARHAIQVASILPERFSATLLARALELTPTSIVGAVDEAIRADLLVADGDAFAFRHDLLRRAAQQTIPYALRRALERDSATILLELGAAPEEVATRLARSADIGDRPAVEALRRAAQSLRRSDPSGAADLSRRAFDLLRPDDGDRASVVTETIVLLNQALRYDEAMQLGTASLSNDMPTEEQATIRLIQSIVSRESPGRRAGENREALQLPGLSRETRLRHLAWLAHNLAGDGQPQAARGVALDALAEVDPDSDDDVQAATIAECALVRVNCAEGRGRDALARLEELQPDPASPHYLLLGAIVAFDLATALATTGHLAEATDVLTKALENSRQIPIAQQVLEVARALGEFAAGSLTSARQIVEDAIPEAERLVPNLYGGASLVVLAAIAAHTDDRSLLRQVGIAARAALDGGPAVRHEAICALAHTAWQRGDDAEAARWLGEEFDLLTSPMWTVSVDHVVLAARVASTSSDASLRLRVLDAVEAFERDQRDDSLLAAVAAHARGLLENDIEAIGQAMIRLASSTRPLLHAGAVEDYGHALAEAGDVGGATERLNAAFDVYVACECTADAHRVARARNVLGVQRRIVRQRQQTGWDSLTASELRVLELVADGATNREVAQSLSVSSHTVNTHVRNVYAKLGIHTRAELTALARGTDK